MVLLKYNFYVKDKSKGFTDSDLIGYIIYIYRF